MIKYSIRGENSEVTEATATRRFQKIENILWQIKSWGRLRVNLKFTVKDRKVKWPFRLIASHEAAHENETKTRCA